MRAKGVSPEFQEFLLSNKLATEKNVLFMAVWAGKFLAFSNRKGQMNTLSRKGAKGAKKNIIRASAKKPFNISC